LMFTHKGSWSINKLPSSVFPIENRGGETKCLW